MLQAEVMAKRKFSSDLPPEVVDRFGKWVELHGYIKQRVTEAALELLQRMPDPTVKALLCRDYETAMTTLGEWAEARKAAEHAGRVDRAPSPPKPKRTSRSN
jgi:hypothetical protein